MAILFPSDVTYSMFWYLDANVLVRGHDQHSRRLQSATAVLVRILEIGVQGCVYTSGNTRTCWNLAWKTLHATN